VDAACAAIFQQTTSETNFLISCMHFCNVETGNSFHQWGRAGRIGVPNKNRFRPCGASFNPARALLRVPFYWKGDLVPRFRREQTHQHIGAENSRCWCHLSAATPIPFGRRGWDAGSTSVSDQSTRFNPDQCFHVISVHIERGIRVPDPSRAKSSDNRVPANSCRCHLLLL